MNAYTPDFSLAIEGVKGYCPVGEAYAERNITDKKIPVLSCEGPCIRGEIARLAASLVAQEMPSYARACHAETFLVPHSTMARWVREADRSVMIDGCFLKCHGRVLKKLIGEEKIVQIDALPLHKKYSDVFLMEGAGVGRHGPRALRGSGAAVCQVVQLRTSRSEKRGHSRSRLTARSRRARAKTARAG